MAEEYIVWDGSNTEEVVRFCASWEYELCEIYQTGKNLITGKEMLTIEPSDTMRGSCCHIQLGERAIRKEKNHHRYIKVEKEEVENGR